MHEIIIYDIPDEGLSIEANKDEPWVKSIVDENLADIFFDEDKFDVSLFITNNEKNIIISGDIDYSYHPLCDRCLEPIYITNKLKVSLYLLPTDHQERRKGRSLKDNEPIEELDDSDVTFYSGDKFDLQEIIREFFVLSLPLKNLCNENCKGICPECGADLNKETCKCKKDKVDPRWGALAKLKGENK